jgi:hypothetical protein
MFLSLLFVVGILLSLTLGGVWLGAQDVETINSISVFRNVNFFGLITVAVPNVAYFTTGMAKLVQFDFAFFDGGFALLRFILVAVIGSGTLWGIFTVIIVVATNLLRR